MKLERVPSPGRAGLLFRWDCVLGPRQLPGILQTEPAIGIVSQFVTKGTFAGQRPPRTKTLPFCRARDHCHSVMIPNQSQDTRLCCSGRLQSPARWITRRWRREMGVCGHGCEGISIPVLGAGAGPPEGQGSAPSLSGDTASDPAGLGLRPDHQGPHRVVRQDALAGAEGAVGVSSGSSSPRDHHFAHPGWGAL